MMTSPVVSKHLVPDGVRFYPCSRISVSILWAWIGSRMAS